MDRLFIGDALEALKQIPSETVDTCVTSPPYYGLRDYGADGQIGLEKTPEECSEPPPPRRSKHRVSRRKTSSEYHGC